MLRPRTPEELWEWTYRFLGIRYPRDAVCVDRGHTSPFEFIAKAYCEEFDSGCNVGPRGGGKTIGLSVLHHANSLFKPGCWTVHVGAIEAQAKRCNAYMAARMGMWPWHRLHDRRSSTGRVLTYLNGRARLRDGPTRAKSAASTRSALFHFFDRPVRIRL